jgi:uncharacterized protein DUF6882
VTPQAYSEFRHDAVHALMDLNDECTRLYDLSTWPRWDYELEAGTLVFSEGGVPKVVASVQVVGTTSTASKNWLWGWANRDLPKRVTDRLHQVRDFGEAEGLVELIQQSLPDNEYLGWAMTAIAARILGGKGGYRVPSNNGFIYFVFVDIARAGDAATTNRIACSAHDWGFETLVCAHLVADPAQTWFSGKRDDSQRWPDAWCPSCDAIFQQQGKWNDHNAERIKIKRLCHHCYEMLRAQAAGSGR